MTMYILDLNKLEEGDILLTTQKSLVSKAIKAFTGSDFSHAILHVGGGSYIHSDGDGVHAGNLQRLLFEKIEYVKVLRVVNSVGYSTKNNVCMFARSEVGKEYSVKDAVSTKNKKIQKSGTNRQFCSRLVAQAFEHSGVKLVNNPLFCSPQELDDSIYTKELSDCLRIAKQTEIDFANSDNPLAKQAKITNHILKQFRIATNSDVQTFDQILTVLIENPQYDSLATTILTSTEYLDMWKWELERNPWRCNYEKFISLPMSNRNIKERAEHELVSANNSRYRFIYQRDYYLNAMRRKNLQYVSLNINLYIKLIEICDMRIDVCEKVLKIISI